MSNYRAVRKRLYVARVDIKVLDKISPMPISDYTVSREQYFTYGSLTRISPAKCPNWSETKVIKGQYWELVSGCWVDLSR